MNAIEIQSLRKTYDTGDKALKGIDLNIKQGSFFGLLGPNGAGKTTTIGILTGLVNKTSGSAKILGHDIITDFKPARKSIGLSPQEINLDVFFSVRQILLFQAGYYGVPQKLAEDRVDTILKKLDLYNKRNETSRHLSGGMKRRIQIAKALVHNPPILILDEPTAGVDIELRHMLWDYLKELNKEGKTILLTTHYIEEAEMIADRIGIINHGELLLVEEKNELIKRMSVKILNIKLKKTLKNIPQKLKKYNLKLIDNGKSINYFYNIGKEKTGITSLLSDMNEMGINLFDIQTQETSLEDIFVKIIKD